MFVADCAAALALTLAASEWEARVWEMRGPGRWAGTMTRDLAHWEDYGVETAAALGAMLQAEYEREERKAAYDWPEPTPEELAEIEAIRAEEDAAEHRAEAERAETARWTIWDYEVDDRGRVRLAA